MKLLKLRAYFIPEDEPEYSESIFSTMPKRSLNDLEQDFVYVNPEQIAIIVPSAYKGHASIELTTGANWIVEPDPKTLVQIILSHNMG